MTDRRKVITRAYKERTIQAGVFQIHNTTNGKVLLGSSLDLNGPLNRHKFMLSTNMHPNKPLQDDWNTHGKDAFVFEVLEVVKVKDEPGFDIDDELKLLEEIWLEKLDPFGEKGYNLKHEIRQV